MPTLPSRSGWPQVSESRPNWPDGVPELPLAEGAAGIYETWTLQDGEWHRRYKRSTKRGRESFPRCWLTGAQPPRIVIAVRTGEVTYSNDAAYLLGIVPENEQPNE